MEEDLLVDLILIQDGESGIPLFECRGPSVRFDEEHEQLFSGFLTAGQCTTFELKYRGACPALDSESPLPYPPGKSDPCSHHR